MVIKILLGFPSGKRPRATSVGKAPSLGGADRFVRKLDFSHRETVSHRTLRPFLIYKRASLRLQIALGVFLHGDRSWRTPVSIAQLPGLRCMQTQEDEMCLRQG